MVVVVVVVVVAVVVVVCQSLDLLPFMICTLFWYRWPIVCLRDS